MEAQKTEVMDLSDFRIVSVIGKGSHGQVFKAYRISDAEKKFYAVKEVQIQEGLSKEKKRDCLKEAKIMKTITHPNIIKMIDSFISDEQLTYDLQSPMRTIQKLTNLEETNDHYYRQQPLLKKENNEQIKQKRNNQQLVQSRTSLKQKKNLYIVMEYAEKGDLFKMIMQQKQKGKYFAEKQLWEIAWQICLSLLHIHSHDIIHRDIKCMNILMNKDKIIKLGDLSESTILQKQNYVKTRRIGTPLYLSPEIIKHESYDHRTDIWSFGVVMYHLAALDVPFYDNKLEGLMKQILFKAPKPFQVCYSQSLQDFIFSMLEKNKSKRPFVNDLFKFFPHQKLSNQIDIQNLELYSQYQGSLENKRAIDGNKMEIRTEFEVLKGRMELQKQEDKKKRSMSIMQQSFGSGFQITQLPQKTQDKQSSDKKTSQLFPENQRSNAKTGLTRNQLQQLEQQNTQSEEKQSKLNTSAAHRRMTFTQLNSGSQQFTQEDSPYTKEIVKNGQKISVSRNFIKMSPLCVTSNDINNINSLQKFNDKSIIQEQLQQYSDEVGFNGPLMNNQPILDQIQSPNPFSPKEKQIQIPDNQLNQFYPFQHFKNSKTPLGLGKLTGITTQNNISIYSQENINQSMNFTAKILEYQSNGQSQANLDVKFNNQVFDKNKKILGDTVSQKQSTSAPINPQQGSIQNRHLRRKLQDNIKKINESIDYDKDLNRDELERRKSDNISASKSSIGKIMYQKVVRSPTNINMQKEDKQITQTYQIPPIIQPLRNEQKHSIQSKTFYANSSSSQTKNQSIEIKSQAVTSFNWNRQNGQQRDEKWLLHIDDYNNNRKSKGIIEEFDQNEGQSPLMLRNAINYNQNMRFLKQKPLFPDHLPGKHGMSKEIISRQQEYQARSGSQAKQPDSINSIMQSKEFRTKTALYYPMKTGSTFFNSKPKVTIKDLMKI